jgi:outer membrane protein assembly factor BamD (BamD/ComL family)
MRLFLPLLALLMTLGCRGPQLPASGEVPKSLSAKEVPMALERAQQELALGRTAVALEWMMRASEPSGLPTSLRNEVQTLLERAAEAHIEELERSGADPKQLELMTQVQLPRHVAVTAGIAAARRYQEQGKHRKVYEVIRSLDAAFPMHHERAQAGAMLVDSGLALSLDERGFLFFWRARDDAYAALNYVTIEYPSEPRGDLAHARLAEMYEEDRRLALAISAHEDLILNYPGSSLRPYSEARIPHLRLRRIQSPVYDRNALLEAHRELMDWLGRYPEHELRFEVVMDLEDALRRLAESDLSIAAFYDRVGNAFGTRYHAQRALELAAEAGDGARVARAERMLASLPEDEGDLRPDAEPVLDGFQGLGGGYQP